MGTRSRSSVSARAKSHPTHPPPPRSPPSAPFGLGGAFAPGFAVPARAPRVLRGFLAVLALLLTSGPAAADDDLTTRAHEAFEAARANTLREPLDGRIDAVWHTDLVLAIRPDPQLQFWADTRRRLQSRHLTYRLVEPSAALTELPADPGSGMDKWYVYMRAPFGTPRELAARYVSDYLGPALGAPESGYVLTHQLTVLEWSRMTELALPEELWDRKPVLLARIAEEHAADQTFSDLFAERICFLSVYGNPSDEELERSVRIIVDAQTEPGVWAPPAITLVYDGQSHHTEVEPEHARKMSMVALAEYLRRNAALQARGSASRNGEARREAPPSPSEAQGAVREDYAAGVGGRYEQTADAGAGAGADADAGADAGTAWWIAGGVGLLAVLLLLARRLRS